MTRFLLVLIVGVPLAACASASAAGKVAGGPPLNVPPPPQHVVEPAIEPTEPVPDLPAPNPAAGTRPARPAATAPKGTTEAKPEPKPGDTKPPETESPPIAPVAPPPPAPNAQLRTPATADTNAEKTVRDTIDRARGTLSTVNFGPLSNDRKKAYNDVKLFMQEAEDALKQGNLVFAQAVATKAETLAKELSGR